LFGIDYKEIGVFMSLEMNKKAVINTIKDFLDINDVCDGEIPFDKDSLDSLGKINLMILLEEEFSIEISIVEIFESKTLGDLADICLKIMKETE